MSVKSEQGLQFYNDDIERAEVIKKNCFICGRSHQYNIDPRKMDIVLLFHHVLPKRENKESHKGMILCRSCHRNIHWLYKNFDKAELIYNEYKILKDEKSLIRGEKS